MLEALREAEGGVILRVEVVPGASKDSWMGFDEWRKAVKVRVAAPPRGGKANEELLEFVADSLGFPRAEVSLISGSKSRQKELFFTGIDISSLARRLREVQEH